MPNDRLLYVGTVLVAVAVVIASPAAAQSLICFGNEPSWSVTFTGPDEARFSTPDGAATTFRGKETRIDPLRERAWRGTSGAGGDLVVFLREAACSDGMSDTTHPVTARVSMPDGAFLAGCCRIPTSQVAPAAFEPQEREFLGALESATEWSIDASGLLHLHRPDGERVLVAGPRRR